MSVCLRHFLEFQLALAATVLLAVPASRAAEPDPVERSVRVMINWDEQSMWRSQLMMRQRMKQPLDAAAVRKVLEDGVDEHARAGIDRFVYCAWARFDSPAPGFKAAGYDARIREISPGFAALHDAGLDQVKILRDRCRQHGMQFLVCLRMNDRHGIARKAKFYVENPDLRLDGYPGALDYKHVRVRNKVVSFVAEVLERYDVDGIELDYMRWCHMFDSSEAEKNAPLLTDMTREIRSLVDAAAKKRGRKKLLLSARIPQTLTECRRLGFDVKSWVQERLVDYICPSDFFFSDFNIAVDQYVSLCRGTDCKVYPTIHPLIQVNHPENITRENCRALVRGFYASGAAGVSTYNYQYNWRRWTGGTRGLVDGWPKTLGWLTELKNPQGDEARPRQYLFYPLWQIYSESGVAKAQRIAFERKDGARGDVTEIRLFETNPRPARTLTMQFKSRGLSAGDRLTFQVNGHLVPGDSIARTFDADGQDAKQGRPCGPFHRYVFPLKHEWLKPGVNRFKVVLAHDSGQGEKLLTGFDFEVAVTPVAEKR